VTESPFRRRTVVILVVVCSVSLVTTLLLLVFGPEMSSPPTASSNGYSRSAVGHRALADVLRESGIPVVVSRMHTPQMRDAASLLVVAEPALDEDDAPERGPRLDDLLRSSPAVLLVLPKRRATENYAREGWVRSAEVAEASIAQRVLARVAKRGGVVDRKTVAAWHVGELGVSPEIDDPRLVSPRGELEPLVAEASGTGVLVGTTTVEGRTVAVLSDADLVATHGLVRGDNALFVTRLIDRLREGREGAVLIDETLHGFEYEPGVWRELFRFPLALSVIAALVAGLLLVWAGIGRFGSPEPPPPPIAPGKAFLLASTADLLRRGGHVGLALERYLAATLQDVARATHAPQSLDKAPLREWLERVGEARGASSTIADLEGAVARATAAGARDPKEVVAAATAVHAWRKEMIDGPDRDS
jgi:hypothetical protein